MKKSDKNIHNDHNEKFVEKLLSAVAQEASRRTVIEYVKKQEASQKKVQDKLIHNTRELLKKYRVLKKTDFKNQETLQRIDENFDFSGPSWNKIKDRCHSSFILEARRTHFSLERLDMALQWFKEDCFSSGKEKDEVIYQVVYDVFIDMSVPINSKVLYVEVGKKYNVSKNTIYNYINEAIPQIESYLWGLDLIKDVSKN